MQQQQSGIYLFHINKKNRFVKFRIKLQKYNNTSMHKTKVHCLLFTCFNKNLFQCLHLFKFLLFIQYVVITDVNYPELFHQTQFTHCRISITINFANNFALNIILNIIVFKIRNVLF